MNKAFVWSLRFFHSMGFPLLLPPSPLDALHCVCRVGKAVWRDPLLQCFESSTFSTRAPGHVHT